MILIQEYLTILEVILPIFMADINDIHTKKMLADTDTDADTEILNHA